MADFYSRSAVGSLIKEVTPNTALTPITFFEFNEVTMTTLYDRSPSMPVAGNRAKNIRPIVKPIPSSAGTVKMNVEPKQLGHFLNGLFGGITGGKYLPMTGVTGAFAVGDSVTQAVSSATGVVAAVINGGEALLITGGSGTFNTTNLVTGTPSSATGTPTAFSSTVYGYKGVLPANSLPTYTMQYNMADSAVRYMGCRFQGLDSLAQTNNIITAGVKVWAQSSFRHAYVTAITTAGSTKTITVDQTLGLVTGDSIKLYRPGTGFQDFSGVGVKTNPIASVPTSTTFTVSNLQVATAVGDLIMLAPQTPTYTVGNNFAWVGGSSAYLSSSLTTIAAASASAVPLEDFTIVTEMAFEDRHAAVGTLLQNRFPAAVVMKGFTAKGTFKTYYQNEELVAKTRTNTPQTLRIVNVGDQIGATGIYNTLSITFPNIQFQPIQTPIANDAVVENAVSWDGYYDATSGQEAYVLFVTDVTTY